MTNHIFTYYQKIKNGEILVGDYIMRIFREYMEVAMGRQISVNGYTGQRLRGERKRIMFSQGAYKCLG